MDLLFPLHNFGQMRTQIKTEEMLIFNFGNMPFWHYYLLSVKIILLSV